MAAFLFSIPDARSLEGDAHALISRLCSAPASNLDVLVNNIGTLYTFCPLTLRAKEWIDEHVQEDAQWFGHASGVTSKAANGGHFKTGQRKWPGTRLFYSAAS